MILVMVILVMVILVMVWVRIAGAMVRKRIVHTEMRGMESHWRPSAHAASSVFSNACTISCRNTKGKGNRDSKNSLKERWAHRKVGSGMAVVSQ